MPLRREHQPFESPRLLWSFVYSNIDTDELHIATDQPLPSEIFDWSMGPGSSQLSKYYPSITPKIFKRVDQAMSGELSPRIALAAM